MEEYDDLKIELKDIISATDKEFFMETLKVQTSFWMRTGLLCDVTCNK